MCCICIKSKNKINKIFTSAWIMGCMDCIWPIYHYPINQSFNSTKYSSSTMERDFSRRDLTNLLCLFLFVLWMILIDCYNTAVPSIHPSIHNHTGFIMLTIIVYHCFGILLNILIILLIHWWPLVEMTVNRFTEFTITIPTIRCLNVLLLKHKLSAT